MVMHGRRLVFAQLLIIGAPVTRQRLQSGLALRCVEPHPGEQHPRDVDPILKVQLLRLFEADTKLRRGLNPRPSKTQLSYCNVVRRDVPAIELALTVEHLSVVWQAFAFSLVVVNDVQLAARVLREPDAGGIGHAEIPPCIDA
jgi:hypothetical protein